GRRSEVTTARPWGDPPRTRADHIDRPAPARFRRTPLHFAAPRTPLSNDLTSPAAPRPSRDLARASGTSDGPPARLARGLDTRRCPGTPPGHRTTEAGTASAGDQLRGVPHE